MLSTAKTGRYFANRRAKMEMLPSGDCGATTSGRMAAGRALSSA